MIRLTLSFLGPFQVTRGREPVADFESNKVRALLAYLAVEAQRPHRREALAELLWPDQPDRMALSDLRYALFSLRQTIGDHQANPPFLLISRETLQFNTASDHWLDVEELLNRLAADKGGQPGVEQSEEAIALYQGRFLEGFSVRGSPAFEEWVLFKREQIERQVLAACQRLAAYYERRGDCEWVYYYAGRQIELEPWREEAHQQLMRALARSGQRSAALHQYEVCRRILVRELGVEPTEETTTLYQRIRDRVWNKESDKRKGRETILSFSPPPGHALAPQPPAPPSAFVGRERELARLDRFLEAALDGQGQVVFVTGDAGSGKTALVEGFARRAMAAHPDVVAATGRCSAPAGIGDRCLPFREMLLMLSGKIEGRDVGGTIMPEHTRRLQALVLAAMQALVDETQSDPFTQFTQVLHALAEQQTLLLVLDDLQWADSGSLSLLFHLGRHLRGSRILLLGAYRPAATAMGYPAAGPGDAERYPLEFIANELERSFEEIEIRLEDEGRRFVDALLDIEPNGLGEPFRETVTAHTGGHPLFTVELLRGLQERGDLVQDGSGRWVEGPGLNWEKLPTRVEAVIADRLGRLPPRLLAILTVACVEGDVFTAEVAASVRGLDHRKVIQHLSGGLSRQHHLVQADSFQRLGVGRQHPASSRIAGPAGLLGQCLSRYRFQYPLIQKYLYQSLDAVERAHLHEAVGNALEALYRDNEDERRAIAPELARHFAAAGAVDKAEACLQQVIEIGHKQQI